MNKPCETATPPSGRVIKTLSNIRFIRSFRTPRQTTMSESTKDLIRETQKQASEAYVQRDHEPACPLEFERRSADTVKVSPPPHPWRKRQAVTSDPDTEALIAWFYAIRARLPAEPYQLTAWEKIANPTRFYDALAMDIVACPNGPRFHVIGKKLRHLREYVERFG